MNKMTDLLDETEADLERRFGGLRRLYGEAAYERLRGLHLAVVGLGGVGSWAAEALARCGVAALTLIDLDHVAESNVNRQVQALSSTLGQAKVQALRERIAQIHPGCLVRGIEAFVEPDNWPGLLDSSDGPGERPEGLQLPPLDGLVDACDQSRAKEALAAWALRSGLPFVGVGAAGGKRRAEAVELDDLARASHDPLLASLRQRLRREHGAARQGDIGLRVVFSRESVSRPPESCELDGSLNCHGYGSSVMVTASFGMAAASALIEQALISRSKP